CMTLSFTTLCRFPGAFVLFPLPTHRTGQARFAHPALGERFTVLPTESWRFVSRAEPVQTCRAGAGRSTAWYRLPSVYVWPTATGEACGECVPPLRDRLC